MIGRYLNGKNTEEPIREKRESADDSYWLIQEVEGRSQPFVHRSKSRRERETLRQKKTIFTVQKTTIFYLNMRT